MNLAHKLLFERLHALNVLAITLGDGCFCCLQAVFGLVDGVRAFRDRPLQWPCNGRQRNPGCGQVCGGTKIVEVQDHVPGRVKG